MAVIQELSAHMADLIAAGEVVERPASVVKELIENAIDAGATQITAEIENGGITFIRITDDGCGIEPSDAAMAFRRHATSKLRTEEQLSAIGTLGFRGEALAAIAAVSRIDLLTKQKGQLAGTHLHLEAGTITQHEDAGCPEGTTIVLRDLFFNTPARMKFLKKDFTEAGYVLGVMQHAALSHPEISFTVVRDGKQVFCTAGDGKLMTPIFSVFGRDITENLVEIAPYPRENLCVWGYLSKPHAARPNRSMQHFFVNGRYVKNRTMQAALEEAYRNKIITGKYPSCALFLTLPLSAVDVNVHPAKTEIKFASEKQVFDIVYAACKSTLESSDNIPSITQKTVSIKEDTVTQNQQSLPLCAPPIPARAATPAAGFAPPRAPEGEKMRAAWKEPHVDCDDFSGEAAPCGALQQPPLPMQTGYSAPPRMPLGMPPRAQPAPLFGALAPQEPPSVPQQSPAQQPSSVQPSAQPTSQQPSTPQPSAQQLTAQQQPSGGARVIGEAFRTYIVAEDKDGLLLIDKHAAHERMIFNRLRRETEIPQQRVLTPVIAELSPSESAAIAEHIEEIRAAGFDIEPFGNGSFAVRGAPAYLDCADITSVLSEMAGKLLTSRAAVSDRLDDLIHMVSCKAAIKAGSSSGAAELQSVCDRVLQDPEIAACPHGRPVTVRLTRYELDKLFKRVNQ